MSSHTTHHPTATRRADRTERPAAPKPVSIVASIAPGLAVCITIALAAYGVAVWPALNAVVPVSALTAAILFGVLVRLLVPVPAVLEPGIRWTLYWLLRAGIVLLGFRLVLQDLVSLGAGGLVLVLSLVFTTLVLAIGAGRWLGLPDTLSVLVGSGTGICGASAVVAVDGVIRAREAEVACAVTLVTVFGTIAMFAYPAIAHAVQLPMPVYAAWAGGSIHEVAQAVAAGFAYSDPAGAATSLYKLSRVALLAPVCGVLAIWWRARAARGGHASVKRGATPFPWFVLVFLAMVLINSAVSVPDGVHDVLTRSDSGLLAAAMAAMGLSTRLAAVWQLGWRPVALGALVTLWISALSLGGALWLAA